MICLPCSLKLTPGAQSAIEAVKHPRQHQPNANAGQMTNPGKLNSSPKNIIWLESSSSREKGSTFKCMIYLGLAPTVQSA